MPTNLPEMPFPNSYWVEPRRFMAGEYPGVYEVSHSKLRLERLLKAGVSVFFDLTQENDARPYLPLLNETAALLGRKIHYIRMPIVDFFIPTVEEMKIMLNQIDAALAARQTIYVHCIGGLGRTGTVVGCYLVRHGQNGEQALLSIQGLREHVPNWWESSPESPAQREMVRNWKPGQ